MTGNVSAKKKIFIIEEHPIVCLGLKGLINAHEDFTVCGVAKETETVLDMIYRLKPDIILTEIVFETGDGLKLIRSIKSIFPAIEVIVFSMYEDYIYAKKVLLAGAKAYVPKSAPIDNIIAAIRSILKGNVYLSKHINACVDVN